MIIKLDLANAFDRVRHDFIFLDILKYGFSNNFIRWIKSYISAPWITPLVNGSPTYFFNISRGICKGCSMSLFLYILVADSLNTRLNILLMEGNIPGLMFVRGVQLMNRT